MRVEAAAQERVGPFQATPAAVAEAAGVPGLCKCSRQMIWRHRTRSLSGREVLGAQREQLMM